MTFEWDEAKNRANVGKHGLDFDLAATAFQDADAIEGPVQRERRKALLAYWQGGKRFRSIHRFHLEALWRRKSLPHRLSPSG